MFSAALSACSQGLPPQAPSCHRAFVLAVHSGDAFLRGLCDPLFRSIHPALAICDLLALWLMPSPGM